MLCHDPVAPDSRHLEPFLEMGSEAKLLLPVSSRVAEVFWSFPPSTTAPLTTEVGKQQSAGLEKAGVRHPGKEWQL